MARYIDADVLFETLKEHKGYKIPQLSQVANSAISCGLSIAMREIRNAPTADVAPKSEVAREIFEAVDSMLELVCAMTGLGMTYFGKYAELKKKYTEGEG